jgi:hypothetical protein
MFMRVVGLLAIDIIVITAALGWAFYSAAHSSEARWFEQHNPTSQLLAAPSNNRVNATVRPVTPLAVASVAPVRPARYAAR